ncbi:hypothetical protein GQ473_03120 [archaeon]|nr:hypothetical protein [archaeon]
METEIKYDSHIAFICGQTFTIERWNDIKTFTLVGVGSHLVQALYTPECLLGCGKTEVFNMFKILPVEVLNLFCKGQYNYCKLKLNGELLI